MILPEVRSVHAILPEVRSVHAILPEVRSAQAILPEVHGPQAIEGNARPTGPTMISGWVTARRGA